MFETDLKSKEKFIPELFCVVYIFEKWALSVYIQSLEAGNL